MQIINIVISYLNENVKISNINIVYFYIFVKISGFLEADEVCFDGRRDIENHGAFPG